MNNDLDDEGDSEMQSFLKRAKALKSAETDNDEYVSAVSSPAYIPPPGWIPPHP
jgi:hypothetical protein